MIALRNGIHALDFTTGRVEFFADAVRDTTLTRYNDGKCDRHGRFWVGTLDDGDCPGAALYRVAHTGDVVCMRDKVTCSNGIDWSPDGRIFYWVDSPTQTIFSFDFDEVSGEIRNPRPLITDTRGLPDGIAVDADGCIWCARWDGWCVVRYAPDGRTLTTVRTPVARPTSVAFGGSDFGDLFITTAASELPRRELARQPLAGALLVHRPAMHGLPTARFGG